jgi:hypothetical protein
LITIHTLRAFVAIKGTQSFSHALDVLYSRTIHIQLYFAFVKRQIVCFGDTCNKIQGDRDCESWTSSDYRNVDRRSKSPWRVDKAILYRVWVLSLADDR